MKKITPITLFSIFLFTNAFAQIDKIEPPFWWTDMPVQELQLQLYGENLGQYRAVLDYPGVTIKKQIAVDSQNYLFLYLDIDPTAQPGTILISLQGGRRDRINLKYELLERESRVGKNQGFDASDLIYLMMPDRFANGDPDNDTIEGMLEAADRTNPERRQGGDIAGVMNHLDYIKNLGMTAIWFTPIFENDMTPEYGAYHGYAATDLYKVDRRFGSNEEYKALIDAVHNNGMKVIMDMIHNHIGDQHWWMKDLPTKDWVHDFEEYGQTNYRGVLANDPYISTIDKEKMVRGWFVREMPDLDQRNELLADYLIQNTIWWIEYSGIDGIRMDTYVYPYPEYMARWAKEILEAYPNFNIVGESWVENVLAESYWQYDAPGTDDGYNSHLPSVTDFPFSFAARDALNEVFGWTDGVSKLFYLFNQDGAYADAMKNVIFLDNHDMSRIFEHIGRNEAHFKMLYNFLLTARGIPVIYYGTELMMGHENRGGDDEAWRQTMPGGWPDDKHTVFTAQGRTDKQNEILEYTTTLNEWRKTAVAIHEGNFTHFVPTNGVYIYFRQHSSQNVMVVMNSNEVAVTIPRDRLAEILDHFSTGTHVLNGEIINLNNDFEVPAKTTGIWELGF
jgi:glycosidase